LLPSVFRCFCGIFHYFEEYSELSAKIRLGAHLHYVFSSNLPARFVVLSQSGQGEDRSDLLTTHIREHGRLYHHMAFSVLRSNECAADACQQAFLRAWQNRHEIRDPRAIRPFLTQVVVNESYRSLRRARIDQKIVRQRTHWLVQKRPGHAELYEQRELLVIALEQLPENVRLIVTLRAMHGLRGNEVSELLNVEVSDVSRKYQQGLDLLRTFLTDQSSDSGPPKR